MDEGWRIRRSGAKANWLPSCQGFIHFREGNSLGKRAPEKFWIELHLRKLCDVESRGRGRREVESTNRDEPRRRQKRRPSLPLKLRSKKGRGRGTLARRLARAAREGGALGPLRILSKRSMHRCTLGSSEQNSVAKNENRSKVPSRVENVADESDNISE